ncbi:hypothetical protein ANO11243_076280 [Dothideomycetidae sp. 11243]|nr:hypothetical protein ANO11243_076280 [fungal sp. No.11243]
MSQQNNTSDSAAAAAAAGTAVAAASVETLGPGQAYDDAGVAGVDDLQIMQRYGEERAKRLREDGYSQFVDISLSDKFAHFQEDLWVDPTAVKDIDTMFPNRQCKLLVVGAGLGGLMYAVHMVQAGFKPEDIRIIDTAGGFGGTWYHNRYPGLMCDIESYCYLPLLEETGYMPKHRYSYGHEIREYAEHIARHYKVNDSAVFSTKAEKLTWDETAGEWQVELVQKRKDHKPKTLTVRSQFVATSNGILHWPKLPGVPGILEFGGDIFHSSRWDYSITGGSQDDPLLVKLQDKRVAIVGTGASAVQIVPQLARWSKHLYVVQRTPSAVDHRDQRETDADWFHEKVAGSPGWQRQRMRNFNQHLGTGDLPKVNLVDDSMTTAPTMVAVAGNPLGPETPDQLPDYMKLLYNLDHPRQNRIRARTDEIVKDHDTADKLKAWYPTWCKRPTFHDDYLPTFNRDNVTLIDTKGKSLDCIDRDSIVVGDKSYAVDVIILATGYREPFGGTAAEKANMTIVGRDGVSMTEAWAREGPSTLHGLMDCNFPNLFLAGPWQGGLSPNYLSNVEALAVHAAYVWKEGNRRVNGRQFVVAPSKAAAKDWGDQVAKRAIGLGAIRGCTPGYFNLEGMVDHIPPEAWAQVARSGMWGHGIESWLEILGNWRSEGSMAGMEVRVSEPQSGSSQAVP